MLIKKPFFSVVMPTYNRAHLLPKAIKSVLQQTFTDFELIISNGGSTDNTKDVVAGFNDPRIRYIESKERLSIGDNYQTGLDNTTGEYITFLSDDDAYVPVMFERVKRIIDEQNALIITFQVCRYYHEPDLQFNRHIKANTLIAQQFTNEVTSFNASHAIENLFCSFGLSNSSGNTKFITSYLANAVYHHEIFSKLKVIRKKLFAATPADMYLAAAVLYVVDSYFCLDEPLLVWSQWANNATASPIKKRNQIKEHYEKLLGGEELLYVPLKFVLPHNCTINAILQAKHDFKNHDGEIQVDWKSYYKSIYQNLIDLKNVGVDVSEELNELYDFLSEQPNELRQVVNDVNKISNTAKRFLKKNVPPFAKRLAKQVFNLNKLNDPIIVNGNKAGFSNVLEAANFVGHSLLNS
jgi:glycosyltransferase involved in cell wall biosynthesis